MINKLEKILLGSIFLIGSTVLPMNINRPVLSNNTVIAQTLTNTASKDSAEIANLNKAVSDNPKDIQAHFKLGEAYMKMGKIDEAILEYKASIDLDKKCAECVYGLGIAYVEKGKINNEQKVSNEATKSFDEAIKIFNEGLKLGKNKANFYNGLGLAEMEKGDLNAAEISFLTAEGEKPNDPTILRNTAEVYLKKGVTSSAITKLEDAVKVDSLNAELHFELGTTYEKVMNFNSAANQYKETLKIDSTFKDAYFSLGKIYVKAKEPVKAISILEKYCQLNTTDAQGFFNLGLSYSNIRFKDEKDENERIEKAISSLEKAVELDPKIAQAYKVLGALYMQKQDFEKSVENYKKGFAIAPPNTSEEWFNIGKSYFSIKNYTGAEEAFNEALKIESDSSKTAPKLYYNLGYAYFAQSKWTEAANSFEKKVESDTLSPESERSSDALFKLGYCYIYLGQEEKAVNMFNNGIKLKPDDALVHQSLGRTYVSLADQKLKQNKTTEANKYFNSARDELSTAIKLSTNDCDNYSLLAFVYSKLENYSEATSTIKKAINCNPSASNYLNYYTYACQAHKTGDNLLEELVTDLEKAKTKYPNNADINKYYKDARDRRDMEKY